MEGQLTIAERRAMLESANGTSMQSVSTNHSPNSSNKKTTNSNKVYGATNVESCVACKGTVYPTEKVVVDSRVFHTTCIRCTKCNRQLSSIAKKNVYSILNSVSMDVVILGFGIQKHEKSQNYVPSTVSLAPTKIVTATTTTSNPPSPTSLQAKSSSATASTRSLSPSGDACAACGKTVYIVDKMAVDGVPLHKNCFRCTQCKTQLQIGKSHTLNSAFYCHTHYQEVSRAHV